MNRFSGFNTQSLKNRIPQNKLFIYAILGLFILGVLFWSGTFISGFNKGSNLTSDGRIKLPDAKAATTLNKELQFPIRNDKGEEVAKVKYIIENAEVRDQLVVKGKKATAVKGRTFFVLNLKIVNDFNKGIEINARDYVRLSVNGNDSEWLAADVHNDPVAIQAISTKYTRLAFPINDSDKNFRLQIGEIKGNKETVEAKF